MGGKGSGGQNRLTPEQHRLRGTYREDRHGLPRARARRSFEMLGRSEDESETAFRRRRGLESTAIEDDDSDRDDQDDDVEDD